MTNIPRKIEQQTDDVLRLMKINYPQGIKELYRELTTTYKILLADTDGNIPERVDHETLDTVIRLIISGLITANSVFFDHFIDVSPHSVISLELGKMVDARNLSFADTFALSKRPAVTIDNRDAEIRAMVNDVMEILTYENGIHLESLHREITNSNALRKILNGPLPEKKQQSDGILRIAMARLLYEFPSVNFGMETLEDLEGWLRGAVQKIDQEMDTALKQKSITDFDAAATFVKTQLKNMKEILLPDPSSNEKPRPPSGRAA